MVELKGIPAAPGLATGPAVRWEQKRLEIPRYPISDAAGEKNRLTAARARAAEQLHALKAKVARQAGAEEAAVFEAQAMFLDDSVLVGKAEDAIQSGQNSEAAWLDAVEFFARQLADLTAETLRARAADVRDAGQRVVEILLGVKTQASLVLSEQAVLIAHDLTPSQTATLDASKVLAFCTAEGGPTSHTAILAKALRIPAVVGLSEEILNIADKTLLLVDGIAGSVTAQPDEVSLRAFEVKIREYGAKVARDNELAGQPAVTMDGHRVEIVANVGSLEEARLALQYGAEGIGLLRSEFLFINRERPPSEEEQREAYAAILDTMGTRPVVARTLDVGGDKEVPYYDFGREANPFLGYRAIRISLDHPEDLSTQLRALLRASSGHDLRIMFPMIATLEEIRRAKSLFGEARREIATRELEIASSLQLGMMVEIPAAVLLAEKFAAEVDFFSIGTNDLTQYTMAAERGNKRLSHLNDPCHPAVLRQIERVTQAAHQAGIWVGVCGEMAGDLDAIPVLLGLGVDELSMAAGFISAAKQVIRRWALADAQAAANLALDLDTADAVRQAMRSCRK